jgi:hypothetical protein
MGGSMNRPTDQIANASFEITEPLSTSDKGDDTKFCMRMAIIKIAVPCYSKKVLNSYEGPVGELLDALQKDMDRHLYYAQDGSK